MRGRLPPAAPSRLAIHPNSSALTSQPQRYRWVLPCLAYPPPPPPPPTPPCPEWTQPSDCSFFLQPPPHPGLCLLPIQRRMMSTITQMFDEVKNDIREVRQELQEVRQAQKYLRQATMR